MRSLPGLTLTIYLIGLAASATAAAPSTDPPSVAAASEAVRAARKVMMNDPAAALMIGINLERRAATMPDGHGRRIALARANWIAGEASLRLNRIDDARRLITASYVIAVMSGDPQSQGDSLLSRGSIKSEIGDPAGALQDYLAAYRLFQRTADARGQSITLQNMSSLYADARDFKRAESYLRHATETYRGEPLTQLALANNTANLLSELGRYSEAEKRYRLGRSIARELGLHALELQLLSNLALAQIRQGRLAEAAGTVDDIVKTARRTGAEIGDKQRETMARLALAQGKLALARQIMDEILSTARKAPAFDEETHQSAYEIFKAAGDARGALAHFEIASRLRNAAVALGISNKAALAAARFDFATQELRISALTAKGLQRDIAQQRDAATRERTIFAGAGLLVLIVLTMLSLWLATLRRSRDRSHALNGQLEEANTALQGALYEVRERARAERHANQLAREDTLTGLPNRRQFNEDFLDRQGLNSPGNESVILLIDLDRFKAINDIHGHDTGDIVLVAMADRLKALCGQVGAKAVRLGGDEFVIVMDGKRGDAAVEQLASEIIQAIGVPIYVRERRLTLGASIGIARYPRDAATIGDLLRAADKAMYEAKRSGTNRCRFFDPSMEVRARLRVV